MVFDMGLRFFLILCALCWLCPPDAAAQRLRDVEGPAARLRGADAAPALAFQLRGSTEGGNKSLKGAVLLSLIWPGAGEFYLGYRTRGIAMATIEAGAWTAWALYKHEGDKIREEFRAYADANWREADYRDFITDFDDLSTAEKLQFQQEYGIPGPDFFSHTLDATHTQQYYELIGKYDQFTGFWGDYDSAIHAPTLDEDTLTPMRAFYESRRRAHNRNLKRATMSTSIVFLNRLASLVDTLWIIRGRSRRSQQVRLHVTEERGAFGPVPTAGFTVTF